MKVAAMLRAAVALVRKAIKHAHFNESWIKANGTAAADVR
jgi:hypothetical protein